MSISRETPNTELEPQLKYEQLGEDVQGSIIANDRVSCLCLSDKILALGTESGNVHVLDYSGNEVRRLTQHKMRVNDLSFDRDEEHLASCSDDCSVAIVNLYSDSDSPTRYQYENSVKTVALDPRFSQRKTKEFVMAGAFNRQVTFSTQGWLGRSEYSLYEGAGVQLIYDTASHQVIRLIKRSSRGAAEPSQAGTPSKSPLGPTPAASRRGSMDGAAHGKHAGHGEAQGGKVSLIFGQNKMLYIGWPDCIKGVSPFGADLAVLSYPLDDGDCEKKTSKAESSTLQHSPGVECQMEVAPSGQLSLSISPTEAAHPDPVSSHASEPNGAEHFGPMDYSLVPSLPATSAAATSTTLTRDWGLPANAMSLFYASAHAAAKQAAFPGTSSTEHSSLPSQGAPQASAETLRAKLDRAPSGTSGLDSYASGLEYMYFVVSPKDILVGRTRDSEDRITWLLARKRFEEALLIAEADRSLPHAIYDNVVNGYINDLMTREAWDTASQLSRRLLKDDASLWETWVQYFAKNKQLTKLARFLPTDSPRLRHTAYEMALTSMLLSPPDHQKLFELVKIWPPTIYSAPTLVDAIVSRMKRDGGDTEALWNLLAHLYTQQGRPDLSLSIYLQLLSPLVFEFIEKHALVASLMGRAAPLMEIDEEAALKLLIKNCDVILPTEEALDRGAGKAEVVSLWRHRMHKYLAGVFKRDRTIAGEYHELQIKLIADYSPIMLMDFLTSSQYYPLEGALAVCEEKGMVPEQVFILGRMGNATKALHLIIEKLGDIPQTSLHEGCNVILRSDCNHLIKELYRQSRQAVTAVNGKDATFVSSLSHVPVELLPTCVVDSVADGTSSRSGTAVSSGSDGAGGPKRSTSLPGPPPARDLPPSSPASQQKRVIPQSVVHCRDVGLWMGFNLENAATHIKLAKEEVYSSQHDLAWTPGRQGPRSGRHQASMYDDESTQGGDHVDRRRGSQALPSLVMR
eukprot:gene8222-1488_t